MSLSFYASVIERYWIDYPEIEIEFSELPKEFDGFKIAVISDLHYGRLMPKFWIRKILKSTESLEPDIIVGLGDYVKKKDSIQELKTIWPILSELKARDGVFFVNGNHDHWASDDLSLELLEKSGFSVRHKAKILKRGEASIAIAGIGDFWEDDFGLDLALRGIPKSVFRIVLGHNPDSTELSYSSRVDLFLMGHTHGGQVRIPISNYAPILPVNRKSFSAGLVSNTRGVPVFISKGIGWSILPIRFNTRPEIPVIVLRKKVIR